MPTGTVSRRHFLGATLATLAGPAFLARPARAAARPLTFGYQATLWGAPAILAEQEKVFEKAGARVDVRKFSSGKDTRDAMISGSVDLGSLGGTPFIVGVAKGEVAAIGAVAYAGRTLMVVAAKDRGIKSVADLKGRKVASQRGSSTDHIFQSKILPKFGLGKGDVEIVNTKFQDHVAAVASRSVDAFAGVDPYPAIAEHQGIGVILVDYGAFDLTPVLVAINRPVLQERRDEVVAFLRGWVRATRMFTEQPDRAATIVWQAFRAQGHDVPEAVIRKAVARLDVNAEFVPALKPYLVEQSEILVQQRQIAKVPDWDAALVADPLRQAMKG